ncbi:MAG TPA: hypothetical protein VN922_14730, partial [Bacteroidia bacterium]|nr:hypothetical protein [Bacteroidia bacterium]
KAYRNGKRVSLSDVGAKVEKGSDNQSNAKTTNKEDKTAVVTGDKKDIKFKVQLGVYKGTPPMKMREKFKKYKNLAFDEDAAGTHYNIGPYSSYNEAKAMKEKAIASGIKGAFVVAYLKDKVIPIQQALSILNQ